MAAYHGKKLADMHGAERAARIKQLLANPGTRSLVPTADLPGPLRQQRDMNTRLAAPIVDGSQVTNRDLAHQRQDATTLQFGAGALAAQQQREKDTSGWYDQYLQQLEQHRQNVQAFGNQAQAQVQGLGNVQGPPGSTPTDAGVQATAGQADAVRKALLGSMVGQQAGQASAANTYADSLAHVVAPGQKIQALTAAAGKTDALKQQIGAFGAKFDADTRASEAKNVLAQQALTGKTAAQQTQDAIEVARLGETARHNKTVESTQAANVSAKGSAGDHYGYTNSQWQAMNPTERAKAAKKWKSETSVAGKGKSADPATQYAKDFYSRYGVKPASTAAVGSAKNEIQSASSLVKTIRASQGNEHMSRQDLGRVLLSGQPGSTKKGQESAAIPKVKGLWATVALDLYFNHGLITAGTADRLHRAGYSVKLLGLSTGAPTVTGPKDLPSGGPRNPK